MSKKARTIELTKGKDTVVDEDDYAKLSKVKWYCSTYGYAVRTKRTLEKRLMFFMHREIMNCPDGLEVDHINGNKLDNRKANLRICNRKQNCRNLKKPKTNTSGYKGVSFSKNRGKYRAYISHNNKQIWIGYYETAEEAALAYNNKAIELHKDFAKLNEV